jgi:hypothetical protein
MKNYCRFSKESKIRKREFSWQRRQKNSVIKKSSYEAADLVLISLSPKIIIKKFKDDDSIKNNMNINQMIIYNNPLIKNVILIWRFFLMEIFFCKNYGWF